MAGRPRKYASDAEKQKAFRNRQSVTKCPLCEGSKCIPVPDDVARQFGVYCECLCFECNGLVTADGRVWQFRQRAHDLPQWVALKD